jgi:subtilisin
MRPRAVAQAEDAFKALFEASVDVVAAVRREGPRARVAIVFEASDDEVEARLSQVPEGVVLEREIPHRVASEASALVRIVRGELPVPEARVHIYRSRQGEHTADYVQADADGRVALGVPDGWTLDAVLITGAGIWSRVATPPLGGEIACAALPDGPLGWWHHLLGVGEHLASRGAGIRVGVVDTGSGPHPCLDHVHDAGVFLDHQHEPGNGQDVSDHGSHVCGLIGARSTTPAHYAGMSPGVDLHSARVYSATSPFSAQWDIANAVERLALDEAVDLVNVSITADMPSLHLRNAIQDARDEGALCFCAAGNDSNRLRYPAAFPEAVAVSAIGLDEEWGPQFSLARGARPDDRDGTYGILGAVGVYFASFSCFGPPDPDCAAPGVGIISCIPGGYGDMNGTSMATPLACGALAAILSSHAEYGAMPRGPKRADLARNILHEHCVAPPTLALRLIGRGIPVVRPAAPASSSRVL